MQAAGHQRYIVYVYLKNRKPPLTTSRLGRVRGTKASSTGFLGPLGFTWRPVGQGGLVTVERKGPTVTRSISRGTPGGGNSPAPFNVTDPGDSVQKPVTGPEP